MAILNLSMDEISRAYTAGNYDKAFYSITEPLHELIHEAGTLDLIDEWPRSLKLVVAFDYIRQQVGQGGFIQFIQNGYTALLADAVEVMGENSISVQMMVVLDDALKLFVENAEVLSEKTTVEEFAKLYDQFPEFDALELRYQKEEANAVKEIVAFVLKDLKRS